MDVTDQHYRQAATTEIAKWRIQWADELVHIAESGKIEYTTVVPGPYMDYCLSTGFWGYNVKARQAGRQAKSPNRRTGCSLRFVGECVAAIVLNIPEEQTKNRRIRIAEVEYSGQSLFSTFEFVTGQRWTIIEKPLHEADDYEQFVIDMNFGDSPSGCLTDGLAWNKNGEYAVHRRKLKDIVVDVIKGIDEEM